MEKKFDDLEPADQKAIMERLNRDMKENLPTAEQTMYYRFSVDNRGYEWIDRITGNRKSKGQMWSKFYNNEKELVKLTHNMSRRYVRVLKTDWVIYNTKAGFGEIPLHKDEVKDYVIKEKKTIKNLKKI